MKLTKEALIKFRDLWTEADYRKGVLPEIIRQEHDTVSDFIEFVGKRMLLSDLANRDFKSIEEWSIEIHANAVAHGWWENKERHISEQLMNMVSELTEAWDEYVMGKDLTMTSYQDCDREKTHNKPEGFGIELADCVIRIMDTCYALGIDLEKCIKDKHEFNKSRPYRHGGKIA